MSSKLKRFLSLLLAFTMVLSIVPVSAEGSGGTVTETDTPEYVAQIEGTGGYYITLQAAFEAAQDGDTIELLGDVDEVVQLSVSDTEVKTITLDLKGNTWDCGYGTRINAVNLTVKNGTIGSDRWNKETFDGEVDVFHFGGHAKLPSKMVVENVTLYAELHVNNMAPSDEELGLLQSTSRSTSRTFNATEVILESKQYDVVTVQKAAYLTVNGGIFKGGINEEEGAFVTDNRKGETTDSGETVDIEGAKLVTIMAREEYGYTRTERGVTITFVDPTPVVTRPYMEFTVGANYTKINVQKLVNDEWETVTPGDTSTSTYQHTFEEPGSVTFRVDWDNNGTYDRLVVLVKAPVVAQIGDQYFETLEDAFTAAEDGDEVDILVPGTYALSTSGKNITITGAVDGVVFDNIGAKNMGGPNVTFNNVTFDYYPNVNYTGLQHSGDLEYINCTFNGQVFLYGTNETFIGCTFNQNSADAYNVWTYGASAVNFRSCTFNCVGKSVLLYTESANAQTNLTVVDCDFIASAPVEGKAAIEIDTHFMVNTMSKVTIDAATTATGFGTGNVSGNSLWNDKAEQTNIEVWVNGEQVWPIFVAQVGENKYTSLKDAIEVCTNGETVMLLTDITYGADDVVYAHGGATGFGNYDQYNPSIIYIGGTRVDGVNSPSNVNAVIDLNGHTITNEADAYTFLIMDNARLTFTDNVGGGKVENKTEAPVIWSTGTDTVVTINAGQYVTANDEGLMWATHSGDLVTNGGTFKTTASDASLLIVRNEQDRGNAAYFIDGKSTVTVNGGTFYGFNPEKMYDDSTDPFTEFNAVGLGFAATPNETETVWIVGEWNGEIWTKEDLVNFAAMVDAGNSFAGKTVKLMDDIDLYEVDENGERVTFNPIGNNSVAVFEGTFDGQGYTISNMYQNGWALGYEWGSYGSVGLFSSVNNATIKNLTLTGAECLVEGGDVGGITGSATGTCVFENITITNSTFATYNNGCGSIIAWSGAGNYTFKNINITSSVTLAGLWGSFDSSIGGVVGQGEPGATYNFENVDIACRLDVYNDCTASYDYYNYRMCGMIIGRLEETTTIDGKNYPDTSKYNITCTNVTVRYGSWANYHYCDPTPGYNNGRGMRVEAGYSYDGLPANYDHSTCTTHCKESIPFDQLFGGQQYGVDGLPTYNGVTVIYSHVAKIGDTGYWTLADAVAAAVGGETITVIADHRIKETVVIDKDVTLDLNGKTITTAATEAGDYVDAFTILADVTVTGNGTIDARPSHGYTFYVGDKEGKAGNLTIKNGTFYGEISVVNNRLGTVSIEGGEFAVSLENADDDYRYLLNCIDANYNDGVASIVVSGGTFHGFNPENNAAEGAETNFCALGHLATETTEGSGVWTVEEWNGEIWTKEDLEYFRDLVDAGMTFEGKTVTLMADINLENDLFDPIGSYRKDLAFKGTFDGNGKTISNLSQNTWELDNGYHYGDCGLGLFGLVRDATIKNLTINGVNISGESAICGTVAACAYGDCTFENITIQNTKVADYQYYAGGIVGWASGDHEYIGCNVQASTTIAAQWGDFDNSTGGVIGGCGSSATILMKDCRVACRIDSYNDVTSSYQWYAYRRSGMLIGNTGKTEVVDDTTYAAAPQLTCENVTVLYGSWADYHYCEFAGTSWPYVRVEAGVSNSAYSNPRYGHPTDANGNAVVDDDHVHNDGEAHMILCRFDQLYGGGQGVYGQDSHAGVAVYQSVAEIERTGNVYETLDAALAAAEENDTIILLREVGEHTVAQIVTIDNNNRRNTNLIAGEGYKVEQSEENDQLYIFSEIDPIVTITFTDSNSGETVTLKYPSERYDTIQKLIGTNDYADFVLGAEQSELLAYVADGTASNIVMTLHDDVALDAPINFHNKYFQIPVEYAITLDGNGHTITWADGYTGTLLNVESGVSLTTKNLTIDGENAFKFYNDTTTVENGQNWYTRFVDVGEEDKAINANVIVNAGNLTLGEGTKIQNVTIASNGANGKTENTETGYVLKYNDDLAVIKSNGGKVNMNGATITGNAGMILNAVNASTSINANATINGNMGAGNKGGIIIVDGGTANIAGSITGNKAMARSATILGVINGAEVAFTGTMENNKQIGVGSNTAGAMVVLEGASQFVMNGGSISDNVGGRAGAIASRWATADALIELNAGEIKGNTADEKYGWNGASIFLRSPATIGGGMTVEGPIVVNAAPGELDITSGTFTNFEMIVTDGLSAEITGGTFDNDPSEWLADGYVAPTNDEGLYVVTELIAEIVFQAFGGAETRITYPGYADSLQGLVDYYMLCNNANETALPGISAGDYTPVLNIVGDLDAADVAFLGGASTDGTYVSAKPMTWTVKLATADDAANIKAADGYVVLRNDNGTLTVTKILASITFEFLGATEYYTYPGYADGNGPILSMHALIDVYLTHIVDRFGMYPEDPTITLHSDIALDETFVIDAQMPLGGEYDYDLTLDLNGYTITSTVTPAIRIVDGLDVTVKNGTMDTESYCFILGASDGSSAGNLTIESGSYTGETTVASVTKGMLTITGGEFTATGDYGATYLLNCIDANYRDGSANIVVTGGTYTGFDPDNNAADGAETDYVPDGYISETKDDGATYTVREANYIAQVGETKYEDLKEAIEACTNGETVMLIADIEYGSEDVVYAHGGATGFGKHDQYNPSIIYIGGTKGATEAENQPSNVNAVINLNGHSITSNADAYLFLIMDNAKITFVGDGSISSTAQLPIFWATGAQTQLTIDGGTYTTANDEGLLWSTHSGDVVVNGGYFSTTAEDASLLFMLNTTTFNNPNYFLQGQATLTVYGGIFKGFNPEVTMDDSKVPYVETDTVAKGYKAVDNGDGTYTVQPHIIARLHLTDPATGEAPFVPYLEGNDLAALIANGKAFYAGYYEMTLELLDDIELDEGVTIDYPMTINLSGKNITSAGDVFIVTSGANVTINGEGAVAGGASGVGSWTAVWADGGNVTINGGTYSVGGDSNVSDATHQNDVIYTKNGGTVSITGGAFLNDGSVWTLNENDANRGTITVTGGTFHNWNPEDNVSEGPETNFCAQNYFAEEVSENTFVVKDYVRWIKAELLAGNDVTLDRDIVVDGSYIESIPAATNDYGKYPNYGIFNVVGENVTFDLNGHNITYNGHATFTWNDKTVNSCTVAHGLFFANAGANLEICDSVGDSLVTVYGVASGVYSASPNSVINVTGGSWVNKPCQESGCGATNLFLYASHGGKVIISAGNFSQTLDAEGNSYLIVNHNGDYKNDVIDFSQSDITIYGGTFTGMNPEEAHFFQQTADNKLVMGETYNAVAKGYKATDNGNNSWTVEPNMIFEMHLVDANGEAHWLSPMRSNDLNSIIESSKVWYESLQGTYSFTLKVLEDYEVDETVLATFPMTVDLCGNTLTAAETLSSTPVIRVLSNVTVKNGTVDGTAGESSYAFIVGNSETAGTLNIADGTYKGDTSAISITNGNVNISGGMFEATEYEGAHEFTLNCIDSAYNNGTAKYNITGGMFYKFNPENNAAEGANTNFLTEQYTAVQNGDYYEVKDYVEWVQAELLAGNDVTLERDIVITDYRYVHAHEWPSNGNGKYDERHGNGAIFHVIKPGVELDLNGHDITWDAHDDAYCNKRQVSLFMVTVTGNAGETSSLSVKDSVGDANVTVYGMGTGMYVVGVGAKANINGSTWHNYPCKTCSASNIFLYPSHGGTLNISAGIFQQYKSDYLLGWKGSTKPTSNNGVGTDYDETKVSVTGGTFVGFNPEETKFFDVANSGQETINGVAKGYKAVDNKDGTWTVKPLITVIFDNVTMVEGNELPEFTWTSDFIEVAEDGTMLVVGEPEVTLEDGTTEYEITAEAYVFMNDDYAIEVIPGTLTVVEAVAAIGDVKYETLQAAIKAAQNNDTIVVLTDINLADVEMQVLDGSYDTYFLVEGKSVTINLNGKTISGAYAGDSMLVGVFSTEDGGHLTLTGNGTVDVTATGTVYGLLVAYDATSSLTIKNGTYKLDKASDSLVYTDGDENIIVEDGTFTLGNVGTGSNDSPWIFNAGGQNTKNIIVIGGTYNADVFHQYYIFEVKDTTEVTELLGVPVKAAHNKGDGTWTIVDAVAYVDEQHKSGNWYTQNTGYTTLAEAFEVAKESKRADYVESVSLVKDSAENVKVAYNAILNVNDKSYTGTVTLTDAAATLTAAEGLNVTTDLEGYTVAYDAENGLYKVVQAIGVTVTINSVDMVIGHAIPAELFGYTVDVEDAVVTVENYMVLDADGNAITTTGEELPAGTYTITAEVVAEAPYVVTKVDGTLTVKLFDIVASSIVLGNELAMYFYVNIADLNGEDYTAVVTKTYADGRDDVVVEMPYAKWAAYQYDTTQMRFRFDGIAAKEMGDNINVVIYSGSADARVQMSNEYNDCIRSYVERGFAEGKVDSNAELRTMLVDMLNYGAAAQRMFSYGLDDLANKNMTEYQQYATQSVNPVNKQEKGEGFVQTTLMLKSNLGLTMAFSKNVVTTDMMAVVTFTSHRGVSRTIKIAGSSFREKGSQWCIDIGAPLVVSDAAQVVTCTFLDADGNVVEGVYAKDSVASYCARALAGGGGDNYACIVKFTTSAYNYFH